MQNREDRIPLPDQRLALIRDRLAAQGRVLASDLAREFATSEDTIRRDLRGLAVAGLCRRVYGGALPLSPASGPLRSRQGEARGRKAGLGRAAAALVRAGMVIVLDAGSTNMAIARALTDGVQVTVATNALSIATIVEAIPGLDLVMIGGDYDRASGSMLGAETLRAAASLRPDLYFIGACALDPVAGLSVFDAREAELRRLLVARSAAVAVAITDEKLGTAATHPVAAWDDLDHVVVETAASLAAFSAIDGPTIHVARRPGR